MYFITPQNKPILPHKWLCSDLILENFQTKRNIDDDGVSLETHRISCQYPIMEIIDLSPTHTENTNENSWKILQPYPTKDEVTFEII